MPQPTLEPHADWSRIHNEPAMDPENWHLDAITIEAGALHLHGKAGGWKVSGFPQPQDAIGFMLTGDHEPGTTAEPNEYELLTGIKLTWTPIH